jgi:hypothetical protein
VRGARACNGGLGQGRRSVRKLGGVLDESGLGPSKKRGSGGVTPGKFLKT